MEGYSVQSDCLLVCKWRRRLLIKPFQCLYLLFVISEVTSIVSVVGFSLTGIRTNAALATVGQSVWRSHELIPSLIDQSGLLEPYCVFKLKLYK